MSTSLSSKAETLALDEVKPYWRNPRRITDEAVDAVRRSIEDFGYVQPIVVDQENTIIIGHTRYTAMRRMGMETVEVWKVDLPAAKVKQLRIIDNRTHENTWWNYDNLLTELEEHEGATIIADLFPEATYSPDEGVEVEMFTGPSEDEEVSLDGPHPVEFVCPNCFHEWETEVTRQQVLSRKIEEAE